MRLFFESPLILSETVCVENAARGGSCKASAIDRAAKSGQPR
jgi:hypothetical protein